MSEHLGLLSVFTEALELQQTIGCSWTEALQLQRQHAEERMREYEPSNVIQFRPRGR